LIELIVIPPLLYVSILFIWVFFVFQNYFSKLFSLYFSIFCEIRWYTVCLYTAR